MSCTSAICIDHLQCSTFVSFIFISQISPIQCMSIFFLFLSLGATPIINNCSHVSGLLHINNRHGTIVHQIMVMAVGSFDVRKQNRRRMQVTIVENVYTAVGDQEINCVLIVICDIYKYRDMVTNVSSFPGSVLYCRCFGCLSPEVIVNLVKKSCNLTPKCTINLPEPLFQASQNTFPGRLDSLKRFRMVCIGCWYYH